jgi:hypothetical protein
MPAARQDLAEVEGIAAEHLHPRKGSAEVLCHVRHDLQHQEPLRRHPRVEQGAADHAGARAEFQHRLARPLRHQGGDPAAQAGEEGTTEPICSGLASQRLKKSAALDPIFRPGSLT